MLKNACALFVLTILPVTVLGHGTHENGKVATATFTESKIVIDGYLNEPAWGTTPAAAGFTQRDPSEGDPASEWTEVRVLYDRDNLYIGAFCHVRTPEGIVIRDLTRDFWPGSVQDVFGIVLDTFHDHRNGYLLATMPAGAEHDLQFGDETGNNLNWDGVWSVKTRILENGWTAEFAIPFKTLRFSKGNSQVWGVNFLRIDRRKNEWSYWMPTPPRYMFKASLAGGLHGLEGIKPGRNLKVKPYVVTGINKFSSGGKGTEGDFDGGVDVKYGLTSGLTLDLTLNTDFSQVEVDTQQVNLTRFPLFFPEKREFFLENSGIFEFGRTYQLGSARSRETILFFSRRIGLTGDGLPIPILGGARLTGHTGPYSLGFLNIQTRSEGAVRANNFTVARVQRNILANSDVGVMFINRQSRHPNDYNRTWGADANFQFFRDLRITGSLAKTQTPGLPGQDKLGKVETGWDDGFLRFVGSYLDIQKNFNPEGGFVRRPGRRILHNEFGIRFHQERDTRFGSVVRDILPKIISEYVILPDGRTETKLLQPQFRIAFQDGGAFEAQYTQNFERLTKPFAVRRGVSDPVTIPVGDYRFNEFLIRYNSDTTKLLSVDAQFQKGDFFSGEKKTLKLGGTFQHGYRFSTSVYYERNDVRLLEGSFTTDLVGLRLNYSFSTRVFSNALIQYNSDTKQVSSNIRFRFIHRPLSDLYVVYNEQRDVQAARTDRAITLKYTHLLNF